MKLGFWHQGMESTTIQMSNGDYMDKMSPGILLRYIFNDGR